MKLSLTNINLNDDNTVDNLCYLFQKKKHLQYLDLSKTGLYPIFLEKISLELMKAYRILRDLNLSYNMLNFRKNCVAEFQASENFIKNIGMLLKKSMILNHVNFSGMEINKQNLMSLCNEM